MRIQRLVLGELETNCWIVSDDSGGPAIVVDPAGEPEVLLEALAGRRIACVVLTHCHFDHLAAAKEVLAATSAPLAAHDDDADFVTDVVGTGGVLFGFDAVAPGVDRRLRAGDHLEAGEITLRVLHTPGHTPGGICLLGDGHLFSGDTLFAGSVGRTDFPRGDARALAASIATQLAPLADEIAVHPGHGPETTIGRERRVNPFFPRA
ncbi:MAG: MBL fold metallo-hydrolase [Coriobacteriia bacterium]